MSRDRSLEHPDDHVPGMVCRQLIRQGPLDQLLLDPPDTPVEGHLALEHDLGVYLAHPELPPEDHVRQVQCHQKSSA